jgi:hypothetical protein
MQPSNLFERWRLLPLNQVAALKLKEAGETVSAASLPVLQLMNWGVSNGIKPTYRRTVQELLRLQYQHPAELLFLLFGSDAEILATLPCQLLRDTPIAAAETLLSLFERQLKAPAPPSSLM